MGGQGNEERRADRSGGWGVAESRELDHDGPTQINDRQQCTKKDTREPQKKMAGTQTSPQRSGTAASIATTLLRASFTHAAVPAHPNNLSTSDNRPAGAPQPGPAAMTSERRSGMHGQGTAASGTRQLATLCPPSQRASYWTTFLVRSL